MWLVPIRQQSAEFDLLQLLYISGVSNLRCHGGATWCIGTFSPFVKPGRAWPAPGVWQPWYIRPKLTHNFHYSSPFKEFIFYYWIKLVNSKIFITLWDMLGGKSLFQYWKLASSLFFILLLFDYWTLPRITSFRIACHVNVNNIYIYKSSSQFLYLQ